MISLVELILRGGRWYGGVPPISGYDGWTTDRHGNIQIYYATAKAKTSNCVAWDTSNYRLEERL